MKYMKKNAYYRHPNTSSVAIRVLSCTYIPEGNRMSVKVQWCRCNKAGKILYCMFMIQRFKKPAEYWNEWEMLDD